MELVKAGRHRVAIQVIGGNDPPVVLVSAMGEPGSAWQPVTEQLTTGSRVVTYDRPGIGPEWFGCGLGAAVSVGLAVGEHGDTGRGVVVGGADADLRRAELAGPGDRGDRGVPRAAAVGHFLPAAEPGSADNDHVAVPVTQRYQVAAGEHFGDLFDGAGDTTGHGRVVPAAGAAQPEVRGAASAKFGHVAAEFADRADFCCDTPRSSHSPSLTRVAIRSWNQ